MKVDRFTKSVVLLNCIVPVALLGWDAWGGRLGANPVNFAIRTTGILSLLVLLLSLTVTPARRVTGWGWLGQFRRMLGLNAFFHTVLHFLLFFMFDRAASVADTASETGRSTRSASAATTTGSSCPRSTRSSGRCARATR